jgi:hypothetical protein
MIIRMVANAAPTTNVTIRAILPNWATKALLKAFSVSVVVSAVELAKVASMAFATRSLTSDVTVRRTSQPMLSVPNERVTLK